MRDFVGTKKNYTYRYAENIIKQLIHSDLSNVAKNNKLTEEEVWSMVMTVAKNIMPIDVQKLRRLGIDEISLVKGQGKYIVVLVDLETHKLIGLVSKRTQAEIKKLILDFGDKVLSQIEEVEQRTTNAVVEGINNKLKLLKRCGFGYKNFNNFEIRALLFWHFPKSLAH